MLPNAAAHAIRHYSTPGDLVLDPMCGIGTTLVEAIKLCRNAIGVEYETEWAAHARANVEHDPDHPGLGTVIAGDARDLDRLISPALRNQAALAVTSPPYGQVTHGQIAHGPHGVRKYAHRYGDPRDTGNLANLSGEHLLSGFTEILRHVKTFLCPGGHLVVTARPWRNGIELIDLPGLTIDCARTAGLTPVERCAALLGRTTGTDIIARPAMFHRTAVRKNRRRGLPLHLTAHEDVLIFRKDTHC